MTEVLPEGATEKPRTASLFKSMSPETVTLDDALRLLSLPRVLGDDPADGDEVDRAERPLRAVREERHRVPVARDEEQLFTVTLEEALDALAQPKDGAAGRRRSRRCASSAPTR